MIGLRTVKTIKKMLKKSLFVSSVLVLLVLFSLVAYSQQSASCPIAVYEGELVQLSPEAFDPDPEIGPAGALLWDFSAPFDMYGAWQTVKGQRGIFNFWVSVTDGELTDTKNGCVEVFPNNRDPVLNPVPEIFITRGESAKIETKCYDPDNDPVEIDYRFNGKDVIYIMYEPPGTYDLQVICTDGFGGMDIENTKLHILMPEPEPVPAKKPAQVMVAAPIEEPIVELETSQDVELVLPKTTGPEDVELVLPAVTEDTAQEEIEVSYDVDIYYDVDCPPCPPDYGAEEVGDVELVVYDSIYPVQDLTNTTATFEIVETASSPEPAEEAEDEGTGCEKDTMRKEQINRALVCCR